MPLLGNEPGNHQPIANAYSMTNGRQLSLQTIVLMLVAAFVLRNILFRDYRSEEISALKASGQTDEQIDYFVPKKASERKKKALDDAKDLLQMKEDVQLLKEEVKGLRKFLADNKFQGMGKVDDNRAGGKTASEETTKKL